MLSHNKARIKVPKKVLTNLVNKGELLKDDNGNRTKFAELDYLAVQLYGNGSDRFKEFADLIIDFPCGNLKHSEFGLLTVRTLNKKAAEINSCEYLDNDANKNTARFLDRFSKRKLSANNACSNKESELNQSRRGSFKLTNNGVQLLPTVGSNTETYYIMFGDLEGTQ